MPRLLGEYELNATPTLHGPSIRGLHVVSAPTNDRAHRWMWGSGG